MKIPYPSALRLRAMSSAITRVGADRSYSSRATLPLRMGASASAPNSDAGSAKPSRAPCPADYATGATLSNLETC